MIEIFIFQLRFSAKPHYLAHNQNINSKSWWCFHDSSFCTSLNSSNTNRGWCLGGKKHKYLSSILENSKLATHCSQLWRQQRFRSNSTFWFLSQRGDAHLVVWMLDPTENSSEKKIDPPPIPSQKIPLLSLISKQKSQVQRDFPAPMEARGNLDTGFELSRSDRLHFHSPDYEDPLVFIFSCICGCIAVKCITALTHPAQDTFVN